MTRHKLVLGLTLALVTMAGCATSPSATQPQELPGVAMSDEAAMAAHMDDSSAIDGRADGYAVQQASRFGYFVSPFTVRQYYSNYLIRRRCRLLWVPGHFVLRPYRVWIRGHFIVVCLRPFPRVRPPIIVRPTYPPRPTPTPTYTPRPSPTPTYTPQPTPTPTYAPTMAPTATPTYAPTPGY